MVGRRGELIIELFLQDLEPAFVAHSTLDFAYDFYVGFTNSEGGINTSAVVAKATERPVGKRYPIQKKWHDQLAHSNIPVLLLVANVKENRLYYAWLTDEEAKAGSGTHVVNIPVMEVDEQAKEAIRQRLAG
jgi:hypothetical protein